MTETLFRIGAVLLAFVALGFGIPAVIGAARFARTGTIWRLWGYPTYDATSFGRLGVRLPPTVLMVAFAVVCALAVVAAAMLWIPATRSLGAFAGIALIAAQALFWFGFELPYGPPLGISAAILIIAGLVMLGG